MSHLSANFLAEMKALAPLFKIVFTVFFIVSQQTRNIHPMLDQCWSTVYAADPTLGGCLVFVEIGA